MKTANGIESSSSIREIILPIAVPFHSAVFDEHERWREGGGERVTNDETRCLIRGLRDCRNFRGTCTRAVSKIRAIRGKSRAAFFLAALFLPSRFGNACLLLDPPSPWTTRKEENGWKGKRSAGRPFLQFHSETRDNYSPL